PSARCLRANSEVNSKPLICIMLAWRLEERGGEALSDEITVERGAVLVDRAEGVARGDAGEGQSEASGHPRCAPGGAAAPLDPAGALGEVGQRRGASSRRSAAGLPVALPDSQWRDACGRTLGWTRTPGSALCSPGAWRSGAGR